MLLTSTLIASNMLQFSYIYLLLLTLVAFLVKTSENAKILALFPLPMRSHMNVMKALVDPLLERGHEIDLVSHFPLGIKNKRFLDIDISGSIPLVESNMMVDRTHVGDFQAMGNLMDTLSIPIMDRVLATREMIDLRNSSKKYDLIIRHIFLTDPLEAYAHSFKAPSIGIITSVNLPWTGDSVGLPDNPAYIPNYMSPYGEKMNYFQRLFNTITYIYLKAKYISLFKANNKLTTNYFGSKTPPVQELSRRSSLILCNSHFSIHQTRPLPQNFVEVGGLHINENQNNSLPHDLQKTLDSSTQGVVYVSFGSLVKSESLRITTLKAMLETLGELPHKILWKGDKHSFPKTLKIPKNFHIQSWMPQFEILRHPNTKLFISHGGLFGVQESVYFGVPILGIPLAVDQGSNLQFLVEKNMAISITYENISRDSFSEAVSTLLKDKYKTNAEELSRRFKDRPNSPLDTAIYWIEYVIKYKGAPFLKSGATNLEWYQYFLLDVIGGLLVIFSFICVIAYLLISISYKIVLLYLYKLENIYVGLKKKIKFD